MVLWKDSEKKGNKDCLLIKKKLSESELFYPGLILQEWIVWSSQYMCINMLATNQCDNQRNFNIKLIILGTFTKDTQSRDLHWSKNCTYKSNSCHCKKRKILFPWRIICLGLLLAVHEIVRLFYFIYCSSCAKPLCMLWAQICITVEMHKCISL